MQFDRDMEDTAKMVEYSGKGTYVFRNVIIECINTITCNALFRKTSDSTRSVNNKYTLCIKDNYFEKKDLVVIFSNIDYLIEVMKKRIFRLFNDSSDYYGFEDNFEVSFNEDTFTLIVSFDYEVVDNLSPDYKNVIVCEYIIGTLLDGAIELADSEEGHISALKLVNSDGETKPAEFGTSIKIS